MLTDQNGINAIFDETLREIVVKLLKLKVLWQIKHIKQANPTTIPIILWMSRLYLSLEHLLI